MKKRLISLVAAAALVGGISIAQAPVAKAGTVTVKGDTQAQLYGFVWAEYSWNKQMTGDPDHANMPKPDATAGSSEFYKATYDKTEVAVDSWVTRIGFAFKNEDANLTGRIEGGFFHGSNFRLRRAYVEHDLGNFKVLVGQEWILEENFASISAGFTGPAGFDEGILRVPQVRLSTSLDLGSANLDLALAFEAGFKSAVSSSGEANALSVNRAVIPYPAARAVLHFDTGFGAPAKVYAWGSLIPVYVSGGSINDKSETSYAFGAGLKVPVSMVTIGANYQYSDGATNYAGLSNYQPASYYNVGGDDKDTEMQAFNANLVVAPMPCVAVGAEYDYVQFKNNDVWNGTKPKVYTYLGNVKIKTTKYTTLTLEWRHVKAKNFDVVGAGDNDMSGDQVYAIYMYKF